jgi:hypothetical protein
VTVPFDGALIVKLYEIGDDCDGADEPPDPPPQETRSAHNVPTRAVPSAGVRRWRVELLPAFMCVISSPPFRFMCVMCDFDFPRSNASTARWRTVLLRALQFV